MIENVIIHETSRLDGCMSTADLLLHPVRLRIVKAFLGDRALTTGQLAADLGDVPPGSLYRHVSLLVKAGVLQVVAERRVRAVTERTYTLRTAAARLDPGELASMQPEELRQVFMAYVAGLLADFERYISSGNPKPLQDGASMQLAALWLTDAEFIAFLRDLSAIAQPRLANAPAPDRRRRLMYAVFMPGSLDKPAQ